MTANQIAYANMRENQRHNLAYEAETARHNTVGEGETRRHNLATEGIELGKLSETKRHNVAGERETQRHNKVAEVETQRSNLANESIKRETLSETTRHNQSTELIQSYDAVTKRGGVLLDYDVDAYKAETDRDYKTTANQLTQTKNETDAILRILEWVPKAVDSVIPG